MRSRFMRPKQWAFDGRDERQAFGALDNILQRTRCGESTPACIV